MRKSNIIWALIDKANGGLGRARCWDANHFFYIDDAITPDKIGTKLVNPSKPAQENGMSKRNSNLF